MKKTTPKLLKISDKRILKTLKEKITHYIQRNKDKDDSRFLIRNTASEKTMK